ncbi:hypothetical protein [Parvicella tangerina]|uniref:Uncharacterized protein n=1 Tax=Parvicella tangerina TaxID=2829795 RepID=A0A916JM83_9FLAO|nr:hypothetical protein [Parvicella tangerina]CAG5081483.1 hypothetical protein CRYO30217_01644 [Parvicella tangerina]
MKNIIVILILLSNACFAQVDTTEDVDVLELTVTNCEDLKNTELVPHKSHNWYIQQRIVELHYHGDTMCFEVIGLAQCCAKFDFQLEYYNDSTLSLNFKDVSDEECFCGNCPYLFKGKIITAGKNINSILLNQNKLKETSDIYGDNVVRFMEEDSITGIKTIKTYIYSNSRLITNRDLLMIEEFQKSYSERITRIYFDGIEIKK